MTQIIEPDAAADGAPDHEPGRGRLRPIALTAVLAWVVIAGLVAVQLAAGAASKRLEEQAPGGNPVGDLLARLQGRYVVGAAQFVSGEMLYAEASTLDVGGLDQRLRFVVLAAELRGPAAARERLEALRTLLAEADDHEPAETDLEVLALLERLYAPPDEPGEVVDPADETAEASPRSEIVDPDRLSPEERAQLVDELDWYGRLALAPSSAPDDARAAVIAPARRTFLTIIGAFSLAGIVGLGGFVALIVLTVLMVMRRSGFGIPPSPAPARIYVETFALWMAIFLLGQHGVGLLAAVAPSIHLPAVLVVFFASLIALGWPVLRGVSWRQVRSDIGWTSGRGLVAEGAIGLGAYAMVLPLVGVGMVLTLILMFVDTALRGEGAPLDPSTGPAHPIILELASGDVTRVVTILLLGAVAAPIVEETMFRGVLHRHLRDSTRALGPALSIVLATAINTFVFAIVHPQGWVAVPLLMSLATGFTLVREWRGSVLPAMVVHGVSNGLVLGMLTFVLGA